MSLSIQSKVDRVFGHLEVQVDLRDKDVKTKFVAMDDLRFFEHVVIGRKFTEVPYIVSRICGACSIAHFLASVNAVEDALKVEVSEDVMMLKEVMNKIQIAQNTVVHLYFLAILDYLNSKNLNELALSKPELVKSAIILNSLCLQATKLLAGRIVNPNTYVVGGFTKNLTKEVLEKTVKTLDKAEKVARELIKPIIDLNLPRLEDPEPHYVVLDPPTGYLSMSDYIVGSDGVRFRKSEYLNYISEGVSEYSTSKYCLYNGKTFFVGPRARLLAFSERLSGVSDIVGHVREELKNPFANLKAKAVELLYCIANSKEVLSSLKGRDLNIRTDVKVRAGEGVGVIEAPRGLLIHHYRLNEQGIITYANVITPTVMFSKHVEVATKSLSKKLLEEGVSLTEVEAKVGALVRAYDPCLVCAVHLEVRR